MSDDGRTVTGTRGPVDGQRSPEDIEREQHVVELEFELGSEDFFLAVASEEAECELRQEETYRRSDGSVLEYLSVWGADPERVLDLATEAPQIRRARHLSSDGERALFEFVSESHVASVLADRECRTSRITATAGKGRVRAEVPPHVDAGAVIDAFLTDYPDARLTMRRETEREAPLLTERQLHDHLLSDLTDRQLQALRIAHARGYFERPRAVTTGELAAELDITAPTFGQHLRVAERKLLNRLFGE